jgi:single-strand DNA-binding protein
MNLVSLIGNLATDVELKNMGDERQLATFVLAVNRPTSNDAADFVKVAAWNKQAELCERYLAKGRRVGVEGRLRSRSFEEEGRRRTTIEVVATHVQFLSPPDRPEAGAAAADADIPFEPAVAA